MSEVAKPTEKKKTKGPWGFLLGLLVLGIGGTIFYRAYVHIRFPITNDVFAEQDARKNAFRDLHNKINNAYREAAQGVADKINSPQDLANATNLIKADFQPADQARNNALTALQNLGSPEAANSNMPAPNPQEVYIWPTRAQMSLPRLVNPNGNAQKDNDTYLVTFPANSIMETGIQVKEGQVINVLEMSGLVHMSYIDAAYIGPLTSPTTSIQPDPQDYQVQGRIGSPLLFVGDTIIDLDTKRSVVAPNDGEIRFGINSRKKYPFDPTGGFTIHFTIE